MKRFVKKLIARKLNIQNGHVTKITCRKEINSLVRKLAPVLGEGQNLIRMGPESDGGYLVPDDLVGIEACFSAGVGNVSGFERDCAALGMKVFMADHSVDELPESRDLFSFTKKHVGALSSSDFITLDDWVNVSLPGSRSDLLLQIDIEGAEYECFLNASDSLMGRFRVIVAEFHGLSEWWNKPLFKLTSRVFEKILETHTCVHLHPNNCCNSVAHHGLDIPQVMEFTFLRNDRIQNSSYVKTFPNLLDRDNTPKPTLALPKCWYSFE